MKSLENVSDGFGPGFSFFSQRSFFVLNSGSFYSSHSGASIAHRCCPYEEITFLSHHHCLLTLDERVRLESVRG